MEVPENSPGHTLFNVKYNEQISTTLISLFTSHSHGNRVADLKS
jgi:hypothetical protein